MSETDDARNALGIAIDALRTRRATTSDTEEKDAINDQIDDLEAQRALLNETDLASSARAVADATMALEAGVKAAQAGPFDAHLASLHDAITRLQTAQMTLTAPDRLPRTGAAAPVMPAPPPAPPLADVPAVGAGHDFNTLSNEYRACFAACVSNAAHAQTIQWYCDHVVKSRAAYTNAGTGLQIPWYFVAIIHGLEGGFNFGTHLHNGDPLSARTVHAPVGRPTTGAPPFTWLESAKDALTTEGFANQTDWTVARVLFRFESYNGFGYRQRGLRTPYLWSFSNLYLRGKFIADSQFDPDAVSKQCGAAVLLRRLIAMGVLQPQPNGTLS